jgi:Na+/melibiose symporter-like transporter
MLNAIPAGGAYLNDVFTSDIIDYDEFSTGKRNEGIYIVFSSFTPKIVTIFAQSLPLTLMSCKEFLLIKIYLIYFFGLFFLLYFFALFFCFVFFALFFLLCLFFYFFYFILNLSTWIYSLYKRSIK